MSIPETLLQSRHCSLGSFASNFYEAQFFIVNTKVKSLLGWNNATNSLAWVSGSATFLAVATRLPTSQIPTLLENLLSSFVLRCILHFGPWMIEVMFYNQRAQKFTFSFAFVCADGLTFLRQHAGKNKAPFHFFVSFYHFPFSGASTMPECRSRFFTLHSQSSKSHKFPLDWCIITLFILIIEIWSVFHSSPRSTTFFSL